MKKSLLLFSICFFSLVTGISLKAQTAGTLTFNFTEVSKANSATYGSQGRHVLAVWIQTSSGTFVKTKIRNGGQNSTYDHLPTWAGKASNGATTNCMSSSCNIVSATTGATLSSFTTKTITWDGTDVNGNIVADGAYQVGIEECWAHGSSGKTTRYFDFTKGTSPDNQTPTADANFSNISLSWIPVATDPPVASFTSTQTGAICAGQTINFSNTSTGNPTSYSWTFEGGTPASSTSANPTITYSTPGIYSVTLTATNAAGSNTSTQTNYFTVASAPTITGTIPANNCGSGSLTLSATASSGTISWYSMMSGGTAIASGGIYNTPVISSTTTYYVESNDGVCSSPRLPVVATIQTVPIVTNPGNKTTCSGSLYNGVAFTGNSSSTFYTWTSSNTSIGLSASGAGAISPFTPTSPGTTTITVTPTLNNCVGQAISFNITVNETPIVTMASLDTVCVNSSGFTLTGGSPVGGNYTGTGVSSDSFDPSVAGVGPHSITYSYTANGCTGQANATLWVDACAGINEFSIEELNLYPNPSNGIIFVEGTELSQFETLEVIDLNGKSVGIYKVNSKTKQIDLTHLINGNYTFKLKGNNLEVIKRIQLKHVH